MPSLSHLRKPPRRAVYTQGWDSPPACVSAPECASSALFWTWSVGREPETATGNDLATAIVADATRTCPAHRSSECPVPPRGGGPALLSLPWAHWRGVSPQATGLGEHLVMDSGTQWSGPGEKSPLKLAVREALTLGCSTIRGQPVTS